MYVWIIFVILWSIVVVYMIQIKLNTSLEIELNGTLKSINKISRRIQNCCQKNTETYNFIENYFIHLYKKQKNDSQRFIENLEYQLEHVANILNNENDILHDILHHPHLFNTHIQLSADCVQLRRRVRQKTHDMWKYFSSEMRKLPKLSGFRNEKGKNTHNILELGAEYKRSIISNMDQMRLVDGFEMYRKKESENLSNLVQKRLYYLQNPVNCENSRKILCDINMMSGYGSRLHHVVYFLIIAYTTQSTMILNPKYSENTKGGWDILFEAVSRNCTEYYRNHTDSSSSSTNKTLRLQSEALFLKLLWAVPDDLAPQILKFHGDPFVWWIGQILKYILRPTYVTQKMLENNIKKIGWRKPIVGVHVRRTDIGVESKLHNVKKYMTYVEDYYLTLEMNNTKIERRIFLATDDPIVIIEMHQKYPQYTIISDTLTAKYSNKSIRHTYSSLKGIISDILLLSLSDYLVCAFSSNVCRLAYEIMQNYYSDASDRFESLDKFYYFIYEESHIFEAILSHKPRNENEIHMTLGDLMITNDKYGFYYTKLLNGFTKGLNTRTLKYGFYPLFKVKERFSTLNLTDYPILQDEIKH